MGIIRGYNEVLGPRFFLEANGELADDLIPYITKFVYTDEENKTDHLLLVVANPGLLFKDDPRFQEGARFRVRFGYVGDISDIKNAVISKAKPHYPQSGMPTIEMVAFGLEQDMNKGQNAYNYGSVSSSDVARAIAKRYNFTETDIEESNDQRSQARVQPAGVTDIQYIRQLAVKINWDFYIEGVTLHFHKKRYDSPANLTFTYFTDNTGTLLSFSPEVNLNSPPGKGVAGADPKTGNKSKGARPDTSGRSANFRDKEAGALVPHRNNSPKVNKGESGVIEPSPEGNQKVINAHGAAIAQKIDMAAIKAAAEMIGSPQIRARTMITIAGVDQQYSGNWRVSKSTHTIEPKGVYKVSVNLKRDAGKSKDKDNNKKGGKGGAPASKKEHPDFAQLGFVDHLNYTPR